MQHISKLSASQQAKYAAAAQMAATHYLIPVILQDLDGVEKLQDKYLRIMSKATLGFRTPHGLKACLNQIIETLRERNLDYEHDEKKSKLLLKISSVFSTIHHYHTYWHSPNLYESWIYIDIEISRHCMKYPEDELRKLTGTFFDVINWYYKWFTGQTSDKTSYLTLFDVPSEIGNGYPVTLAINPDSEHLKALSKTTQVLAIVGEQPNQEQ